MKLTYSEYGVVIGANIAPTLNLGVAGALNGYFTNDNSVADPGAPNADVVGDNIVYFALTAGNDLVVNKTNYTATLNTVATDWVRDSNGVASVNETETLTDAAAPIVVSVTTSDAGENSTTASDGIMDAIIITYSESVTAGTFTAGNWSFANAGANVAYASAGAIATTTVKLYVTQSASYNGAQVADVIISQVNHAAIKDAANNTVALGMAAVAAG